MTSDTIRHVRRLETLAAESATLQTYLRTIAQFPRLARDQERELGLRIRRGDDPDALNALIEGNLRFVVSYAKRYRTLGVPLLDLIHEGNLGLIEAARHFNPDRDVKFIAHGVWWVRQTILHRLAEAQVAAFGAEVEHRSAIDREITDEEAEALMNSAGDNASRSLLLGLQSERSVDEQYFDDALCDQAIREIDDEATRDALVRELEDALAELEASERLVMRLRYGLQDEEPWTVQQIGERMRLGSQRVRRIERRATQKLRRLQHVRASLN